jgi:hypothetical protein
MELGGCEMENQGTERDTERAQHVLGTLHGGLGTEGTWVFPALQHYSWKSSAGFQIFKFANQ